MRTDKENKKLFEDFIDKYDEKDLGLKEVQISRHYQLMVTYTKQPVVFSNLHGDKSQKYDRDREFRRIEVKKFVDCWKKAYIQFRHILKKMAFVGDFIIRFNTYSNEDNFPFEFNHTYTVEEFFKDDACFNFWSSFGQYAHANMSMYAEFTPNRVSLEQFTKDMYRFWRDFCNEPSTGIDYGAIMILADVGTDNPKRIFNDWSDGKYFWKTALLGAYDGLFETNHLLDDELASQYRSDDHLKKYKNRPQIIKDYIDYFYYISRNPDVVPGYKVKVKGYSCELIAYSRTYIRNLIVEVIPDDFKFNNDEMIERVVKVLFVEPFKEKRLKEFKDVLVIMIDNGSKYVEEFKLSHNPMTIEKDIPAYDGHKIEVQVAYLNHWNYIPTKKMKMEKAFHGYQASVNTWNNFLSGEERIS